MKFEILNLHADILKGISDAGFEKCTPIQEQALPECLNGKDIIAQSQTGTGKTAVFLLAVYSRLIADGGPGDKPRALVMVPTRELAVQVEQDAVKLGKHLPFRTLAVFGGVDYDKQVNALKTGVDLVVATPGRMIDLYKSKILSLDDINIFVIDEADRMFDMGFAPDITYIASRLPKDRPRQTMLFSATIDGNVERLATRYMKSDTARIEIEPEQVTVDAIDQKVIYVSNEEKLPVLMGILKRPDAERVIIFTNMKRTAEMLEWKLAGNGFPAQAVTGDLSQAKRQKAIDGMKSGTLKVLVATDVAARGLHIEGISHVINYDLPEDAANYVHRVGRTARAGKSGKAYSLVCESYALNLPEIEKYIERKIESEWIEDSEMVKDAAGTYRRKPSGAATRGRPGKPASKGAARSAGGGEKRASGRRPDKERPEKDIAERPGRIVRPARPGRPRPGKVAAASEETAPSTVTEEAASSAGQEKSALGRPPRRRRRRRPSSGKAAEGSQPQERKAEGGLKQMSEKETQEGTGDKVSPTGEPRKRRRRRPPRRRGEREAATPAASPVTSEERLDRYKKKYGEEFRGAGERKASENIQEKIDRHLNPERPAHQVAATAKTPNPTAPVEEKGKGFIKKFLGVFKKKP